MQNFHGARGQGTSWPILGLCASLRARLREICFKYLRPRKRWNHGSNHKLDAEQLVRIWQPGRPIYVSLCGAVVRAENPENFAGFAAAARRLAAALHDGRPGRAL